jgi:hypothetical protein
MTVGRGLLPLYEKLAFTGGLSSGGPVGLGETQALHLWIVGLNCAACGN